MPSSSSPSTRLIRGAVTGTRALAPLRGVRYVDDVAEPPRETNEILLLIWQETKGLNGRIDQTNSPLDQTNSRLETGFRELREEFDVKLDLLGRRVVEAEVRTATAVADLAGDVRALAHALRDGRPRLEANESRIQRLEERVDALEHGSSGARGG